MKSFSLILSPVLPSLMIPCCLIYATRAICGLMPTVIFNSIPLPGTIMIAISLIAMFLLLRTLSHVSNVALIILLSSVPSLNVVYLISMPSNLILVGYLNNASGIHLIKQHNTIKLRNMYLCVSTTSLASLAPTFRDFPNGIPSTLCFFPTPAFDDGVPGHGGCTMLQVFASMDSKLLHGVPMKSETEVPDTTLNFIRHYGAMEGLMSDNAKSETSFAVRDILRLYTIKDHQSEPHHQHQNPVERRIQDIKHTVKSIMDQVACPSGYWLLCTLYVIGLLNVLVNSKGLIPLQVITGYQVDILPYLDFHFWEEVFVEDPRVGEQLACWCGPSTKVGDFLTYNVILNDTQQFVTRSNVRHAKDALFPNRQL